jgi:hypothetical protein
MYTKVAGVSAYYLKLYKFFSSYGVTVFRTVTRVTLCYVGYAMSRRVTLPSFALWLDARIKKRQLLPLRSGCQTPRRFEIYDIECD